MPNDKEKSRKIITRLTLAGLTLCGGTGAVWYFLRHGPSSAEPPAPDYSPPGTVSPTPTESAPLPTPTESPTPDACRVSDRRQIFVLLEETINGQDSTQISRSDALASLGLLAPEASAVELECWDRAVRAGYKNGILLEGDVETIENLNAFMGRSDGGSEYRIPRYIDWNPSAVPNVLESGRGLSLAAAGVDMAPAIRAIVEKEYAAANPDADLADSQIAGHVTGLIQKLIRYLSPAGSEDTTSYSPCLTHQTQASLTAADRVNQQTFEILTRYSQAYDEHFAQNRGAEDIASSHSTMGLAFDILDGNHLAKFKARMKTRGLERGYEVVKLAPQKYLVMSGVDFGSWGPEFPGVVANPNQNGGWILQCGQVIVEASPTPAPEITATWVQTPSGPVLQATLVTPGPAPAPAPTGTPGPGETATPPGRLTDTPGPTRSTESPSSTPQDSISTPTPGLTDSGTPTALPKIEDTPAKTPEPKYTDIPAPSSTPFGG